MLFLKKNKLNSIETHSNLDAIPLSDQTRFRLNEINKIKDSFNTEIQKRKTMSKKLSKYIAAFDYIDKTLTFYLQNLEKLFLLQVLLEFLQE